MCTISIRIWEDEGGRMFHFHQKRSRGISPDDGVSFRVSFCVGRLDVNRPLVLVLTELMAHRNAVDALARQIRTSVSWGLVCVSLDLGWRTSRSILIVSKSLTCQPGTRASLEFGRKAKIIASPNPGLASGRGRSGTRHYDSLLSWRDNL